MKKFFTTFFALVFSCICIFACGCNGGEHKNLLWNFNTSITIATQKAISRKTLDQISSLFTQLENSFDVDKKTSAIYKLNNSPVGQEIPLSKEELAVFKATELSYNLADGKFDPTVYPLLNIWGFAPNYPVIDFTPPTDQEIAPLLQKIGYSNVSLTDNGVVKNSDLSVDFGGIVKGHAAMLAGNILKQAGVKKGYVSIGSSSIYIISPVNLSITHPENKGSLLTANLLGYGDAIVSSSGDYQRYYTFNQVKYSHLIDPSTGKPSNTGVNSATVVLAGEGGVSDALSTSLCLFEHTPTDLENSPLIAFANKIISTYNNAIIYISYNDGEFKQLLTNKKQGKDFTLHDNSYNVIEF